MVLSDLFMTIVVHWFHFGALGPSDGSNTANIYIIPCFFCVFSLACVVCREEAKKQNPQKAPNLGPCQVFSLQIGASMIPSKKRIKHTRPLRYVSSMMGSPLTCVTFFVFGR